MLILFPLKLINVAEFDELSILNFVPQGRGKINEDLLSLSENEFKEFIEIFNRCKDKFKGNLRVGIHLQGEDTHKCTAGLSKLVIKYEGTVQLLKNMI